MKPVPWVFVTGAPRSGTTFVGKMLSLPRSVDYIHEPFNPHCGIPGLDTRFIWADGRAPWPEGDRLISPLFDYRVKLRTGMYPEDDWRRRVIKTVVGSRGPFYMRLAKLNRWRTDVVLTDPIGVLLTEYLAQRHGVSPVIMVRHPAAVAASYKRLGWPVRLEALRNQPELVERYFPDRDDLRSSGNVVEDAARLWRALHVVMADQLDRNPDWTVLRHEDLNASPVQTLRDLYDSLGLPWSESVGRRIEEMTSGGNRAEAQGSKVQDFRRDSGALFQLRLKGLTEAERGTVLEVAGAVGSRWYSEASYGVGAGMDGCTETAMASA
ncbi:MAG: sulfotransferase family protein [Longimicrobiales bacterium]